MAEYTLYFAAGTSSRVVLMALEEAGVPYHPRGVRLPIDPSFRSINPKGQVPVLVVDGMALTEMVAVLSYLARFHDGILPLTGDPAGDSRMLSDLAWFAGGIHPLIARLGEPDAAASLAEQFRLVDERLEGSEWFAETYSSFDAYLFWFVGKAEAAGMDLSAFGRITELASRVSVRSATRRALQEEEAAAAELAALDVAITPPASP